MAPPLSAAQDTVSSFLRSAFGISGASGFDNISDGQAFGDAWSGHDAAAAHKRGTLRTNANGMSVRLAFRNLCPFSLMLCWVSETGKLRHFYHLPSTMNGAGDAQLTGLDKPKVIDTDHIERSQIGHAFCLACVDGSDDGDDVEQMVQQIRESKALLPDSPIVAGFRPGKATAQRSSGGFDEENVDQDDTLLVTIKWDGSAKSQGEIMCCGAFGGLRGFGKRTHDGNHKVDGQSDSQEDGEWVVDVRKAIFDRVPFDTTCKAYEETVLGGWPVRLENNWHNGNPKLRSRLESDIEAAANLLPEHAREYLRENCPIWVNRSISYGPKLCPIVGVGCCYHPDQCWLVDNGLSGDKAKCIEINNSQDYWKDVDLWQPGGLILHEMSHAYHHGMLKNGYSNQEIIDCFDAAMKDQLYDCVRVHGKQGPETRAYACSNAMEYFAELSTAFLGGKDGDVEYNKWFPFNRTDLKNHDPRAYKLFAKLWEVDCE